MNIILCQIIPCRITLIPGLRYSEKLAQVSLFQLKEHKKEPVYIVL